MRLPFMFALVPLLMTPALAAAEIDVERDWSLTAFGGFLLDNNFEELADPTGLEIEDVGLIGLGVAKRVWTPTPGLDVEIEGQLVRHFGGQDHWEVNLPAIARWGDFPWDATLDTSVAFGLGLSYAFEEPAAEKRIEGETEQLLAYWMVELELGAPDSDWSFVGRVHHRSSAFGLFGDDGGSNAIVLGVKRRF